MTSTNCEHLRYLGDGVYAGFDGYQVWIWADRDGRRHEVALEGETITSLVRYVEHLKARKV